MTCLEASEFRGGRSGLLAANVTVWTAAGYAIDEGSRECGIDGVYVPHTCNRATNSAAGWRMCKSGGNR